MNPDKLNDLLNKQHSDSKELQAQLARLAKGGY